jgi:geranylgeranyl pyrophosphate synthase
MWQKEQARLLFDEIDAILSSVSCNSNFYNIVKKALTKTTKRLTLKSLNNKPWPLLPLIVCEAISGNYKHALPAAAALEFFKCSAEVFDDIEDADSTISIPSKYGVAIATNVATFLLVLAEKAITRLEFSGIEPSRIIHVIDEVNSLCINSCAGQHLDLSPTSERVISEDEYIQITGMKAASQLKCACQVGALLATKNPSMINVFVKFGHNLGIASQIGNDLQGIANDRDIFKRKITLPVIYALNHMDAKSRHRLALAFNKQSRSVINSSEIKDLLFHKGAIYYTVIKMELYIQQALDVLLKAQEKGAYIDRLKLFLD